MPTINVPDYKGSSIVNLISTIETRLTGSSPNPLLYQNLEAAVPAAPGYVLVLFDGLGSGQLEHPAAHVIRQARVADIDTVFPSTTTVALASIATGLTPAEHGLLGYQMWIPEIEKVANTIKWTTLWGKPLDYNTESLLPTPNLWERLTAFGIDTFTVQPAHFDRSSLTKALYRGCRFEPVATTDQIVSIAKSLAGPGKLVVVYVPNVDFAAHVHGQDSEEYAATLQVAASIWEGLVNKMPDDVAIVGTSDHGHIDFKPDAQHEIPKELQRNRIFYGDGRAMFVLGNGEEIAGLLPATWIPIDDAIEWWGTGFHHPSLATRAPDGILLAEDNALLLHQFSDDRMIGNHGGMTAAEQTVPLLIG